MKAFTAALILLALILTGIAVNYIYINKTADAMHERLDALSDIGDEACVAEAAELLLFWEDHADTVGLSVNFVILDRVSEQARTLLTCAEAKDLYGFAVARSLLRDAVEDMRRLEGFGIGNLL